MRPKTDGRSETKKYDNRNQNRKPMNMSPRRQFGGFGCQL